MGLNVCDVVWIFCLLCDGFDRVVYFVCWMFIRCGNVLLYFVDLICDLSKIDYFVFMLEYVILFLEMLGLCCILCVCYFIMIVIGGLIGIGFFVVLGVLVL